MFLTNIAAIVPQKTEKTAHPMMKIGAISLMNKVSVALFYNQHGSVPPPDVGQSNTFIVMM